LPAFNVVQMEYDVQRAGIFGYPCAQHSVIGMQHRLMNRFASLAIFLLTDEMDRVFEGFGLSRGLGGGEMDMWAPAIEVFEREGNLFVRAELPGLNKEDVKVELTDDGLLFRANASASTKRSAKASTGRSAATANSTAWSRCPKTRMPTRCAPSSTTAC
jgi:HSP20 family molecular chaperone IbpA